MINQTLVSKHIHPQNAWFGRLSGTSPCFLCGGFTAGHCLHCSLVFLLCSFFRNPACAGRKVLHLSVPALYVQEVQVQQAYGHTRPCPCSRPQCGGGACAEGGMHMAGSYPGETSTVDKPQLYCGFQTFQLWLLEPFLAVVGVNSQTVHSLRPFR